MTIRLILAFAITFAAFQLKAEAQSDGRYEINTVGFEFWLPDWISSEIYPEFKNELMVLQQKKVEITEDQLRQCQDSYVKLFNKSDIRWSVYFGYGDSNGDQFTTDIAERELFEREVKQLCPELHPEIQFCGFNAIDEKNGRYKKQIRTKQNKLVTIHLRLANSSVSSDLQANLNSSEQKKRSKALEKDFLEAVHTEDILFYSGHARYGSGPGFRPMVPKSKDWWLATLFRPMMANLNNTMNPPVRGDQAILDQQRPLPKVMGLFVCEAEGHYGQQLAINAPEAGLIMSRQSITTLDNMRFLYAAANSLITETCEDQFQKNLSQAVKTVFYDPKKGRPENYENKMPKIFNFFHKDRIRNQNDLLMYLRTKDDQSMDIGNGP